MRGNSSNMINWVKCPPVVLDSLEKGKATHCSILAWRIPWTVYSPWGYKSQTWLSDFHSFTHGPKALSFWGFKTQSLGLHNTYQHHSATISWGRGSSNPVLLGASMYLVSEWVNEGVSAWLRVVCSKSNSCSLSLVAPEKLECEKLNVAEVTQSEIAQKQKLQTVLEKINETLKLPPRSIKWNVDSEFCEGKWDWYRTPVGFPQEVAS